MTEDTNAQRMRDIDHTHPYDDTSAGSLFVRGPVIAADGGRREADERDRMKDVDHTPPHDDEGAKRVFERGEEYDGNEDVVEE
ncbi:MAG: hypothetical protein M8354_01530 [Halalkalicoccus sp.]|nr:hypothetical protein [Halalkalicoccus sp.]